jgi:hypothetical protein
MISRAGGSGGATISVNGHGRKGKGKSRESEDEAMDGHHGLRANGHGDAELVGLRLAHGQEERARGRLVDESLACRYLAAQCLVRRRRLDADPAEMGVRLISPGPSGQVSRGFGATRGVQSVQRWL